MSSQNESSRTFIEQARREQIIKATIEVLATDGFIKTSFARIGKQAGITPSLIPYHFQDKAELTLATLEYIQRERASYVEAQIATAKSAEEKLRVAIDSDMTHNAANLHHFQAAAEIVFSIRANGGVMTYTGDAEDKLFRLIYDILEEGKQTGEFGPIDSFNLAVLIESARDSFLAQLAVRPRFNLDTYKPLLIEIALQAVQKGKNHE